MRTPVVAGMLTLMVSLASFGCSRLTTGNSPAETRVPPAPAATARPSSTLIAAASATPSASATPLPPLPPPLTFAATGLRPGVEPQTYISDACESMRKRWDPQGSPAGTVVLPIMYHSIRDPSNMPSDTTTVSTEMFQATVALARSLGFETITSVELLAFLRENVRIPERSMLLIVDDRYPGVVANYLLPVAEAYDWTVTLGWIIGDTSPNLWATVEGLAATGRLDVQSHGLRHHYIVEGMSDKEIREEIAGPVPILEEHFGYRPTSFVWPGGNFTQRSVEIAREEGYGLGFTILSRGPLLFDWVPLGEEERAVGDPLMVLPRAWSTAATVNLLEADETGDQAARFAAENRLAEAAWYAGSCGGALPS